jgi:hypothetical protein
MSLTLGESVPWRQAPGQAEYVWCLIREQKRASVCRKPTGPEGSKALMGCRIAIELN